MGFEDVLSCEFGQPKYNVYFKGFIVHVVLSSRCKCASLSLLLAGRGQFQGMIFIGGVHSRNVMVIKVAVFADRRQTRDVSRHESQRETIGKGRLR
eukprot:187315-Pyramimonas_sp.AAC.2